MICSILIKLTMLLLFYSCKEREYLDLNNNLKMDIHENHELPSLERAQYIVSQLSIDEKISQLQSNASETKILADQLIFRQAQGQPTSQHVPREPSKQTKKQRT